ncbi:MAG: DUF2490 domain-containing protein [Chitinophagaceae bacterium]|nr:DUF2490 domain-containing protein [Chitinophagaceae bacterium]
MNTTCFMIRKLTLFTLLCIFITDSNAQTEWLNWNGITLSGSITEKLSARISHTRAYSINNKYENIFNQSQFQISCELSKKWDVQAGVQLISPADTNNTRTRIFARVAYTSRVSKKMNWTNSIRAEINSKNENRFRQRIIFTTRLGLRKRLDFLNLSPSVAYSLFYNIGGNPVRYYDENAQLIARRTPDGFHRSRFTVNFNSKITKYLSLSLYYMRQQEFNFLSPDTRKMNVYDPVRNRILRPFNNYNTAGFTAQFNIDPLFKK